ncbi:hypothetical protein ACTXJ5_14890 [Psychrobacter alimentarius]|uniref:hypothetical protein n=1 Tax=Psychrobacter alimentarius TaxID=261164 RepID=UPI003FCF9574
MLVTLNENGGRKSSGGNSAQVYLLGDDEPRDNARLLKGDPDATTEVINGLNFAKIYTSGTLAFAYNEGEKLSEQDKFDIIEKFENALFPNIPIEQVSGYWVEHTDKILRDEKTDEPILDANGQEQKRLELNFIYANVELTTGKALPIYYHDNDVHLTSAFRDVINAEYDLIDPNAVNYRQSLSIAKNLPKQKKEILESAHDLVCAELSLGNINDRNDILKVLTGAGIEIASKPTHKYISLKDPEGGKNIRMKGEIYEREFTVEKFISEHRSSQETKHEYSDADIAAARERLQYSVEKRAARFERRFQTSKPRAYPVLQEKQSRDITELNRDNEILIEVEFEPDDYIRDPKRETSRATEHLSSLSFDPAIERERAYKDAGTEIQASNSRSTNSAIREPQNAFGAAQDANEVTYSSYDMSLSDSGIEYDWNVDLSRSSREVEKSQPDFGLDSFFSSDILWNVGVDRTQQKREQLDDNANSRAVDKAEHGRDRAAAQGRPATADERNNARFPAAQIDFVDIAYSIEQFVRATRKTVAEVQHDSRRDRAHGQDRQSTESDSKRTASSIRTTRNFITNIIGVEEGISDLHAVNEKIRLAVERQEQQRQLKRQQSAVKSTPVPEFKVEPSKPISPKPRDDSFDFGM